MVQSELKRYTVAHRTEHYVFHALPGTKAADDIERIAVYQEKWFERITQTFQVVMEAPILYYLTNSPEDAGKIYGDDEPCNGFAWGPDTVVATYNDKVVCLGAHEDTHLITQRIARPESPFMSEGVAMYMDGCWWGKTNAWWLKRFVAEGRYVPLASLLSRDDFFSHSEAITYPTAGAFTQYAIETLGQDAFVKQVYSRPGPAQHALEAGFGKPLAEIEHDFLLWVKVSDVPEVYKPDIIL